MIFLKLIKFGGLDLAQRIDNSAFMSAKYEDDKLDQIGMKLWPHIDFSIVWDDIGRINELEDWFKRIHYDRTGVGDGLRKLIPPHLRRIIFPVAFTHQKKLDMIVLVQGLFWEDKLIIHDRNLYREITEQERHITDAGNWLYRHPEGFHDDRFWALALMCDAAAPTIRGMVHHTMAVAQRQESLATLIEKSLKDI